MSTQEFNSEERRVIEGKGGSRAPGSQTRDEVPPTNVNTTKTEGEHDSADIFAKLIPSNDAARIAFHEVATAYKKGKLAPHHRHSLFIDEGSEAIGLYDHDASSQSSFYDLDQVSSDSEELVSINSQEESNLVRGYFGFTFDPAFQRKSGYRIGKGTGKVAGDRNVDILIVPSPEQRSTQTKELAAKVASVHSLIRFHPRSGVLLLTAGNTTHSVRYVDRGEKRLLQGKSYVLGCISNIIWLGKMRFDLEYAVPPDSHQTFLAKRNQHLQKLYPQYPPPHPAIHAIPTEEERRIDFALVHKAISCGAFGMVSTGVHRFTGEPLAIKEVWIKEQRHISEVKKEAIIAHRLSEPQPGLLPIISARCAHGTSLPCGSVPEQFYIIMPLAGASFAQVGWASIGLDTRLDLFHDTLLGLRSLHQAGYMHRDISPKNLLIVSLKPPIAAICDYGKAAQKPTSSNTFIGPIYLLAPEVQQNNPYTNKIDVWSLAYCWFRALFPKFPMRRIDEGLFRELQRRLNLFSKEGGVQRQLADLMGSMLVWNPEKRFTVEEALAHDCMRTRSKDDSATLPRGGDPRKRPHDA